MPSEPLYQFSFTASSLAMADLVRTAVYLQEEGAVTRALGERILNKGKQATSKRQMQEMVKRLNSLTPEELRLLIHGDLPTQRQVAFLGMCKTYHFLLDFVVEVIREKYLLYDYVIHEADYRTFFSRKQELHPEMDNLSPSTAAKIRSRIFYILEEASIVDDKGMRNIQPQLLAPELIRAIIADNPQWLRVFLWSDKDIKNAAAHEN